LARRLITIAAILSLLLCAVSSTLFGFTVFFQDISGPFAARGTLWEVACRGGVVFIDNEPQRDLEVKQTRAANTHARFAWEATHDALRSAMERAPYGPEYTAARLKLDAWEHEHGIRTPGGAPETPSSPPSGVHVHLALLALFFAILPITWLLIRTRPGDRSIRRRMIVIANLALVVLVAVTLAACVQSYRNPIVFYFCTPDSSYTVVIGRGRISIGLPPAADPQKLAAISKLTSQLRNDDVDWTLIPLSMIRRPPTPPGLPAPPPPSGPLISAEIKPDVVAAALVENPNQSEMWRACLRALHDPNRFEAAHVILSNDQLLSRKGLPPGMMLGSVRWNGSRVNNLEVALTAHEKTIGRPTTFRPQIVPNQRGKIELQWHKRRDRFTRELPLWPAALLLALFPIRWVSIAGRQRRRRKSNQCLACGYNRTGNTTGICPECGTDIANPPVAVHA